MAIKLYRILLWIEEQMLMFCFITMLIIALAKIFLRNFFNIGFVDAEPLLHALVLWLTMIAAMLASRDNKHLTIDVFSHFFSTRLKWAVRVFTHCFSAGICWLLSFHAVRFLLMEFEAKTKIADIPIWIVESIIPFGFFIMGIRFFISSLLSFRKAVKA